MFCKPLSLFTAAKGSPCHELLISSWLGNSVHIALTATGITLNRPRQHEAFQTGLHEQGRQTKKHTIYIIKWNVHALGMSVIHYIHYTI